MGGCMSHDFIDIILDVWNDTYKKYKKVNFKIINKGKERSAIGKLNILILQNYPEYARTNKLLNKEEKLNGLLEKFKYLFSSAFLINDDFIRNNAAPSMILNQYNKLFLFCQELEKVGKQTQIEINPILQKRINDNKIISITADSHYSNRYLKHREILND
jgi:hypothetical protein